MRLPIIILISVLGLTACAAPIPQTALPPQVALATQTPQPPDETAEPFLPLSVTELPEGSTYQWQALLSGLNRPVALVNAGDGSGRLFIVQQGGTVRVYRNGALLDKPFLDLSAKVSTAGNEQGLLGLAFHPRFTENGFFFVNYTDRSGNTVIARFTAAPAAIAEEQSTDIGSEVVLLRAEQPYRNHNGGGLAFGADGYLYIGLGDGGGAGDPLSNGQALDTLLGKLLRIDVDGAQPYAIPVDNPFANDAGMPEIWAYGLRNPWGFSFDALTGDLYLADVGQDAREEINFLPASFSGAPANFGWNLFEGRLPYKTTSVNSDTAFVQPVFEYGHDQGCSVTGGAVYRGKALPAFNGVYLFGDFCSGRVWGLLRDGQGAWQAGVLFETGLQISAFGTDEAGEIYMLDISGGLRVLNQ